MRIAYIGCFNAFHTETEIADYLDMAGHEVHRYQQERLDQRRFKNRSGEYDVVITSFPQLFSEAFWKALKCYKIAWYFDWIQEWGRKEAYLSRLRHFDLILSTDGKDNNIYEGLNRVWLPHACDPRVYYPTGDAPTKDVGFIGHLYTEERKRLIHRLNSEFNFQMMGEKNECWGYGYPAACSSVKIMVGDNYRNDIPGYWSDRVYLALASGAFLLYPRVPLLGDIFEGGKHLVFYDDTKDLIAKIKYYLSPAHEQERLDIAHHGSEYCREYQNWAVRLTELEKILDENRVGLVH